MPSVCSVGLIGCGTISAIYLKNLTQVPGLRVAALADLDLARAQARAQEFRVPRACTVPQLLADPEISVVLNLTVPAVHAAVGHQILDAGKSLYGEKPLALTVADGLALVEKAESLGLGLGSAPDTFLGAGLQTCAKLIRDGWIGTPVGASARFLGGGPEAWHPDPAFFYQKGAGPLFDMGPYYLTALVTLLGPVAMVQARGRSLWPTRTVGSGPWQGQSLAVEVLTHTEALLVLESGATVTLVTSFDAPGGTGAAPLEVYGTEGTLLVPDPNTFGGPVRYRRRGDQAWQEVPLLFPHEDNSRGLGLAEMVQALPQTDVHRANGRLALHVLDVMEQIVHSAEAGEARTIVHRPSL